MTAWAVVTIITIVGVVAILIAALHAAVKNSLDSEEGE